MSTFRIYHRTKCFIHLDTGTTCIQKKINYMKDTGYAYIKFNPFIPNRDPIEYDNSYIVYLDELYHQQNRTFNKILHNSRSASGLAERITDQMNELLNSLKLKQIKPTKQIEPTEPTEPTEPQTVHRVGDKISYTYMKTIKYGVIHNIDKKIITVGNCTYPANKDRRRWIDYNNILNYHTIITPRIKKNFRIIKANIDLNPMLTQADADKHLNDMCDYENELFCIPPPEPMFYIFSSGVYDPEYRSKCNIK